MSVQPSSATIRAFDLTDVALLDGPIKARQERNRRYLIELDPDRLLHNFRINAGLESPAKSLGGWESPDHGLRGHFVGHYLSACALMYAGASDTVLRDRANYIVDELAKCQQTLGGGYLGAFPESDLETIETKFEGAWASYYVIHKILAGLIVVNRYCGNTLALEMAVKLAAYIEKRIAKLSPDQLEQMLRTDKPNPTNETGGWSETLQELYAITNNPGHLKLAQVFDREWFLAPLSRGEDELAGLHCNTHIPMALGAARRHEISGDKHFRDAAIYFWERTALARSYVNGGSSGPRPDGLEKSKGGEHWPEANKLANTLTPKINESCVTHNMMRLTDILFRWTGEARYADFYERAYFNSVLTMQHPEHVGGYIYDHPLGSCSHKTFGHADDTFWCCYGSSIEAFARLAQGIYYHDENALWVNLFVRSNLDWREKGLSIEQHTGFPDEYATRLIFNCKSPVKLTVNVRLPMWMSHQSLHAMVNLNNLDVAQARSGSYLQIERTWKDRDVLDLKLPMRLRVERMPDDDRMIALLYGPIVLAAMTDEELTLRADNDAAITKNIRDAGKESLEFRTQLADGKEISLIPLNRIGDEKFGVYFRLIEK